MKRLIAGLMDRDGLMKKPGKKEKILAKKKAEKEKEIRKELAQRMKEYEMNTIEVVSSAAPTSRNLVKKGQESGSSAGTGADVSVQAPLQVTPTPGKKDERDQINIDDLENELNNIG